MDTVTTAPDSPASSPAGRNLPVATAVGALLAALVVGSVMWSAPLFVGLVAVAAVVAVVELGAALATAGVRLPIAPLVVGSVAIVLAAAAAGTDGLVASFTLVVGVTVAWRALEGADGFVRDASASVLALAYVPLLLGFAAMMVQRPDGAGQIVSVLLLVVCSDTGGYLAGSRFGRHRMAPRVSPKKSWEGLAGSVVLAAVVGAALVPLLVDLAWWQGLVLALVVVATATLGDLGESLIKRDLGIKDMSQLLPGHGGLLDRIDSVLVTLPVAWLLLGLF